MTNPKYGVTFKKIREQKQIPLSRFKNVGISKPSVSKFERGQSMMSFENVIRCLQEMDVTLEEFDHFLNNYALSEKEMILEEAGYSVLKNDEGKLKELYYRAKDLNLYLVSLSIKALFSSLNFIELEDIVDYFYEISIWSYTELCLFLFTMEQIEPKDVIYILSPFLENKHTLITSKKYQDCFILVCCRASRILSSGGYKTYSKFILERVESLNLVEKMFFRNLVNMTRGYWQYCFEDEIKGDHMMLQGLNILQMIGNPDEAVFYQERYKFVKKSKNNIDIGEK
ncbi:helix-turn-helix domain-containing protein [Lactococcus garvieae]|uniref:Rgg family transcriptional regulator n=1 Tax=Lactococcus garvieae TaxID=1363 RepID=UPI00254CA833|nr:helix-turn-helix domain-containing protein [Lactococcus garvieae]